MSANVNSSKRKVCIIGGGGYFGQCVGQEFQNYGYDIVLFDIHFVDNPAVQLDFSTIIKIKGSVTDQVAVEQALTDCDSCIHLAAYGMSGSASLDSKKTHEVNVDGTEKVLRACIKQGVSRLVFTSSVGVVFTDEEIINGDESLPYAPSDKHNQYYTLTKSIAERRVLQSDNSALDKVNRGTGEGQLRTCALRFRGIFGPGEPRTIQRTIEMGNKGLLLATFRQKKQSLTQYSGVENSATACRLAECALEGKRCRAGGKAYFILDGGDPVDSFQFFNPLFDSMRLPRPKLNVPYKLVYLFAFLSEWLWRLTGIEPLLTRLECNLLALNNYYSIENARRDLDYNPTRNHDLQPTIDFFEKNFPRDEQQTVKGYNILLIFVLTILALFLLLVLVGYFLLF